MSGFGEFAFGISPFGGSSFAPNSPGVVQTIPAFLYQEYTLGEEDLQNFVDAYNQIAQEYIDWFNMIGLPVYTGWLISGPVLDWVGSNLYGVERPYITISGKTLVGPYNTWAFNTIPFNFFGLLGAETSAVASDDIYKRAITWNYFKGDGTQFNVRWLKRRIMRFLNGAAGINYNVDQTYRISVTFGPHNEVTIRIVSGNSIVLQNAVYNNFTFNSRVFNQFDADYMPLPPVPLAPTLKAGIEQGWLELPFWLTFVVIID